MRYTQRGIIILFGFLTACAARHAQVSNEFDSPGDFGLGDKEQTGAALVDETQFDEGGEANMEQSLIKSSLPLPIKVGRAGSRFVAIPQEAMAPTSASYKITRGKLCQLNLVTDTVQVDRYLYVANGDLIKMKEGLVARQTVAVDRGAPFHFRVSAKVKIAPFSSTAAGACRNELFGRKTALGHFHMAATTVALAPSPGSPPAKPIVLAGNANAEPLFVKWDVKAAAPLLVDAYDAPVYLESPFYRVDAMRDGFYYLVVHPALGQARSAH